MELRYNSLGDTVTMTCPLAALPNRDKITLLHHLMVLLGDMESPEYVGGCEIVLAQANKKW